jgi:hypothetical protein
MDVLEMRNVYIPGGVVWGRTTMVMERNEQCRDGHLKFSIVSGSIVSARWSVVKYVTQTLSSTPVYRWKTVPI